MHLTDAQRRADYRLRQNGPYLMARIQKRASVEGFTECWEWQRRLTGAGYGQIHRYPDLWQSAHRVSYETFVGPIPDDMEVDHLCFNRRCINPEHLEPVTGLVNVRRAKNRQTGGRGFGLTQRSASGLWVAVCDMPRGDDAKRRQKSFTSMDRAAAVAKMQAFLDLQSAKD